MGLQLLAPLPAPWGPEGDNMARMAAYDTNSRVLWGSAQRHTLRSSTGSVRRALEVAYWCLEALRTTEDS